MNKVHETLKKKKKINNSSLKKEKKKKKKKDLCRSFELASLKGIR